ncbi:5'-methylthioadenosine/S-adenosylhomocysteine nucleosidase family protein [Salinibius halmophilus]|uniref:5'-methylthioadenosine/S-adenosylhomocysteine nucleosidase family protein n=1 Tax=Salinibius halmophilus TaxID=1853216 RepID=UPI000E667161|nr:hypothetical protein [Salinibius halmophilus]
MNKILVVDDNYSIIKEVAGLFSENPDWEIISVHSVSEANSLLAKIHFEILVTDIQLPIRLGEQINEEGGRILVEQLSVRPKIKKPGFIIGATTHTKTYEDSITYFQNRGWPIVCCEHDMSELCTLLKSRIEYQSKPIEKVDIAIVTALQHCELEAVLRTPYSWVERNLGTTDATCHVGELLIGQNALKLAAISCPRMGIASASVTTSQVLDILQPDYLFMTGIAAGIEGKVALGDILVADLVWDWGSGKATIKDGKHEFKAAPNQIAINPKYRNLVKNLVSNGNTLQRIYTNWPANKPEKSLSAHLGPIATGSVVLENPEIVESIKAQHRKTIGIEMEGFGFCTAAELSATPPKLAAVIKSVCDFADPEKNDDIQNYAAYTSTSFTFALIEEIFQAKQSDT